LVIANVRIADSRRPTSDSSIIEANQLSQLLAPKKGNLLDHHLAYGLQYLVCSSWPKLTWSYGSSPGRGDTR